jgi:alkylation response protein AidB-like acyl-CoA dehydrogenase
VFLDRVIVDDGCRIGALGGGWSVARTTLAHERVAVGGGGAVTVEQLIQLARERGMLKHPELRDRLMATVVQLEVARLSVQRSRASGVQAGPIGSASKLRTVAALKAIADLASSLIGVELTALPSDWQTLLLTAPSMSIRGGTDEIQRDILAERVLGLPKEPDIYKGRPWAEVPRS